MHTETNKQKTVQIQLDIDHCVNLLKDCLGLFHLQSGHFSFLIYYKRSIFYLQLSVCWNSIGKLEHCEF